jgi:hypothetical protein
VSLSITDNTSILDDNLNKKDNERRMQAKRPSSASHRARENRGGHGRGNDGGRENEFVGNMVTNHVYDLKYFKEVQERLEFLKYILKNGDEVIKPVHIKILWECHIESSFHEKERSLFLEWCASIIKIQAGYSGTRKEGIVIFDDDTIELLFFESLLCLDFVSMTEVAYDCFEEFFIYINVQFGLLSKGGYYRSHEVYETKLIGIQALWEITLQAKNSKVHNKASKFLLTLYKKLSPELDLNIIKEDFLKTCM